MLLVHTGDLHLGKTIHDRDLGEEQEAMLDALVRLLAERKPAALLVAGDIYDRAIPPPGAIDLLDRFLSRAVEAAPGIAIVIIPGNHDSAGRLAFGSGLFRKAGVHVRSRAADSIEPIRLERMGEDGEIERCAIWALPFLGGGADLGDSIEAQGGEGPRGQAELFAAAVGRIVPLLRADSHNVLLAHCFATGGQPSDSERAFVGLAEEVDGRLFDAFDYVALGHLHRPQTIGARGRYPGAPLPYSFGEGWRIGAKGVVEPAARGFLLVDIGKKGTNYELWPYIPRRRLVRIEGSFADFCLPGAFEEYREDFVEASLLDPDPVLDPSERLKGVFPNLLSIRQAAFEIRPSSGDGPKPSPITDSGGDSEDPGRVMADFRAFHEEMMGEEPGEGISGLFRGLVEEASRETD